MQTSPPLTFADSLSGIWSALHSGIRLTICEDEVYCLRMLALALDDELVTNLLLRKLRLASVAAMRDMPAKTVAMNSYVELSFDGGDRQFRQLVHPNAQVPGYGLSVTSLLGAGVIGLSAGQTILWPNEEGSLCDLYVAQVENCPGLSDWLGARGGR